MKRAISIIVFLLFQYNIFSSALMHQDDIQKLCSLFLDNSFVLLDANKAVQGIRAHLVQYKMKSKAIKKALNQQISILQKQMGAFSGYQLISVKNVKKHLSRLVYIVKYHSGALRVVFIFYSPDTKYWLLKSLQWDNRLDLLFNE